MPINRAFVAVVAVVTLKKFFLFIGESLSVFREKPLVDLWKKRIFAA
jgi:hypothetical protein